MVHRADFKNPSTSNSLELTHGHLNKKVPRVNEFWPSMARLVNYLCIHEITLNTKIKHNYNRIKHSTLNKQKKMKLQVMLKQKDSYNFNIDNCLCNENLLASTLMHVDLPCCHRVDCGATFFKFPYFKLNLQEEFDHLEYKIQTIDIKEDALKDLDEFYNDKKHAIRIKRYSHFEDNDKIRQFVDHSYCS